MEEKYMWRAIELAKLGEGYVNPNPLVGAVIVKKGKIIGEGYHKMFGGAHAEINAIVDCKGDTTGARMYVTLEPCCHKGKTPPCTEAIIASGIREVVVGMLDPNELICGKGVAKLEAAGIKVTVGMLADEVRSLNRVFIKYMVKKRPYVIMKSAMTLDGKTATHAGHSKWISGEASRQIVHQIRHGVMGIMVGVNTVIADNPSLTTRLANGLTSDARDPIRIIVDSTGRTPMYAKVIARGAGKGTILATTDRIDKAKVESLESKGVSVLVIDSREGKVDMTKLMERLGSMGFDSILLEGGSTLNWSCLEAGIVDEVMMFIAPKLIGGYKANSAVGGHGVMSMQEALKLSEIEYSQVGEDLLVRGKVMY